MTKSNLYIRFSFLLIILLLSITGGATEPIEISDYHLPMLQGSTSGTEINLNVLVPALTNYKFILINKNDRTQKIEGQLLEEIYDSEKKLHEKVIKVQFSSLQENTEYVLKVTDQYEKEIRDERFIKTLDLNSTKPLKTVTASCFCDEDKYSEIKIITAKNILNQSPELILLMGDLTYVDSFEFVQRGKATTLDVWTRVFRSFAKNPLFRSKTLIPTAATWDDHDTGIDNGDKNTETLAEARKAFQALYGSKDISQTVENGKNGVHRILNYRNFTFVMMDNRSFRDNTDIQGRYSHFGQEQEEWVLNRIKYYNNPVVLISGDLWTQPAIYIKQRNEVMKKISDGLYSDHPQQFENFMKALGQLNLPVTFVSGDVHFSEITMMGPDWAGTSRYFPYKTLEITSSPAYSVLMFPKEGEPAFWQNDNRIVAERDYGFSLIELSNTNSPAVNVKVTGIFQNGIKYSYSQAIRLQPEKSRRRTFLNKDFLSKKEKIKIAFLDADDTLRIAPSGKVTPQSATDVFILPNVSENLYRLKQEGYFIAIVSNQGGVSTGAISFETSELALNRTIELIENKYPHLIDYYDFAENGKEDYMSKPQKGMAVMLEKLLKHSKIEIDWENSVMIGDAQYGKKDLTPRGVVGKDFSNTDRLFAESAGVKSIHPRDFFHWTPMEQEAIENRNFSYLYGRNCMKFYSTKSPAN